MPSSRVLVLDCGAAHVAGGLFSAVRERLVLEDFQAAPLAAGERKEEDWVAAVGAALRELGRFRKFRGRCVVGVPGHLTFARSIRVPAVSPRQRRRILRFEEGQVLPAVPHRMVWSHVPITVGPEAEEVILTAAKARLMAALGAQLRQSGFYPSAAVPAWAALRTAVRRVDPGVAEVLVLSIGARSAQLYSRSPTGDFVRTAAAGGNLVTLKIAEELGVDFPRAEAIKREGSAAAAGSPAQTPERVAIQLATELFVRRLCAEIARSPVLPSPDDGRRRPRQLLLTGGGSLVSELPRLLAEKLQLRVERWNPWSQVGVGPALADLPARSEATQAADLVGLAALVLDRPPARINLFPRRIRPEMFLRRNWRWLAAAALLAAASLLLVAWRERRATLTDRLRVREVEAELVVLRRNDARNRDNLRRLSAAARQIAVQRRLAAARSNWTVFFTDLQMRLTKIGDVWLDRLQIVPEATRSAAGKSASAGARSGNSPGPEVPPVDICLRLTGSLFAAEDPTEKGNPGSLERAKALLSSLRESPFVAGIEHERFDDGQPGLLRFELTVTLARHTLF